MAKSFPNTGATVIDSATDLPTASAALEGILMFQKDTNELKICDGSSWVSVIDTDNPTGLTLIKSVSFSAQSTVSITSCFSSVYTNYRVVVNSAGNGFHSLFLQLMSGVTPVGGTAYNFTGLYNDGASGPTRSTASSQSSMPLGNSSGGICVYTADIVAPFITSKTGFLTFGSGGAQYFTAHGGEMTTAASYDGLYLLTNTGTDTGTIRVYGYRDSI